MCLQSNFNNSRRVAIRRVVHECLSNLSLKSESVYAMRRPTSRNCRSCLPDNPASSQWVTHSHAAFRAFGG